MISPKSVVVSDSINVKQDLSILGLTPEIVADVARQSAYARADALDVDPRGASGTFAYHRGVRAIRLHLIPKGWRICREGNVESTINDDLGVRLIFQNVDIACSPRIPKAISGKGSGSRRLINDGRQRELFDRNELLRSSLFGSVPVVWMLCASFERGRLCAEISCPDMFDGNQFEGFSTRIFVVDEDLDHGLHEHVLQSGESGADEFEVRILKKE